MVAGSSASTYHIHIYPLLMNEAEKCEFISCVGIFIMHFPRVIKISWKSSYPSCDGKLSLHSRLFPRSTGSYATNIHAGMVLGLLAASKLIMLTILSHHSHGLIWGFTTLSRPNKFTIFQGTCQVILVKINSYVMHKEFCAFGWCQGAHIAQYYWWHLAVFFRRIGVKTSFQNMNHFSSP